MTAIAASSAADGEIFKSVVAIEAALPRKAVDDFGDYLDQSLASGQGRPSSQG